VLSFEQIKALIELVATNGLRGVEIERAGFRCKIEGPRAEDASQPPGSLPGYPSYQGSGGALVLPTTTAAPVAPVPATPVPATPVPAGAVPAGAVPTAAGAPAAEAAADTDGQPGAGIYVQTSPIVGTFYQAASPDAAPFVKVGDKVHRGQTLCIIEAMKLMNDIESEVDGEIVEILVKNAQPVEYGEPLFHIRT